jgi:hypothetical protein
MSLEIDIEKISEVLLADGWHKVSPVGDGRSSFGTDAYEFLQPKSAPQQDSATPAKENSEGQSQESQNEESQSQQSHAEDQQKSPPGPAGARWTEADGSRVFCPVTSILAVKYAGQKNNK